jgi:hypothetical protein
LAPKKTPKADERTTVEPSVRVFTKWTPQLVQYAEISADGGNLTQAARICEWLLADDTIRGCLSARVNALLGLVPQFEKSGDGRRSGAAVKALESNEDFWVSYPEQELWLMLAWGLLLGVAPMRHQPRYVDGHGGRLLPYPEFWHPAAGLRWDGPKQSWFINVAAPGEHGSGREEALVPGDGTWLLHTPFGKHRPHALGLWRCLAWWKLLKDYGRGDQARHMEKGSVLVLEQDELKSPMPPAPAGSAQARDADAASLYQRGKDAVAALKTGQHLKLVETAGSASKLYESAYAEANKAFAIAIRGGNLTTNTEGGSKAAAEVQERTGDFVNLRFDAETLATTLHQQSLNWWAQWNFGDAKLAPWPDYPVAPQRNLKNYAETIESFNTACKALEDNGFEVDRAAMIEEFELQEFVEPGKKPEPVAPVAPADPNAPAPAAEPTGPATPEQN